MRIVFAVFDTHRNNHMAQPGVQSEGLTLCYGLMLETDEEREHLGSAYLPTSHDGHIDLTYMNEHLARQRRKASYSTLSIEAMREAMVGLDLAYFFFDNDMLGFDYRRADSGGRYGGATFSFPRISSPPRIPFSGGRITGVYEDGFIVDNIYQVPLPEGATINSMTEPEGQPLLLIAD